MARKKKDVSEERPQDEEIATDPVFAQHVAIYSQIDHYDINQDNSLIYSNGDKRYELCKGSIIITKEVYKFSGTGKPEIEFCIEAINRNGTKLPSVTIPAKDFNSLNWITQSFGTSFVVLPNQTIKSTLAAGILMSGENCERERVCTHTGYIMKNGKPINYMSASGPLIKSDIKSELDKNLQRYSMSAPSSNETERKEAINASLNLLYSHIPEVTGPLFAFTYLSAILPLVNNINGDTSFLLFLQGKTQSGKSTLAALSASHFGKFDSQTPPTTFSSTSGAISVMAFTLKDAPLWVDDYNPQEYMKSQNQLFQELVRMSGDHSTRRRLDSTAKLKESYPPRCLFLVTGEFPPKIGQSGHARVFQIDVPEARKDISVIRRDARDGTLSRAMSDYILYIIENYDRLLEMVKKKYNEILDEMNRLFRESRLSNQAALLCLSAYMFFDYAVKCKTLENIQAERLYKAIESGVVTNAKNKAEQLKQEDPCEQCINALRDLITSGRAQIIDLTKKDLPEELQKYPYSSLSLGPERDCYIGWKDANHYYLNSQATYSAVTTYYTKQDMLFVTTPSTLWKRLRDAKYIIPDNNNTPCRNKKIGGECRRVLCFPRSVLESSEE